MLEGILVRKLKAASEPTAMIAGTFRPKISKGRRRTPPPNPVSPIRVPTIRPITILSAISSMVSECCNSVACRRRRFSIDSDETLLLEMQNDFLRCLFRAEFGGVNDDLGL